MDKTEVETMLDEANRQLTLAEMMGYGKRRQDFASLQAAIKQIKINLIQNQENKGLLSKLIGELKVLKEKIF